jgi:hypothetical protein
MRVAVDAVIVPVEASLLAILAVTLVYASIRLMRRRTDVMSVIFLVSVVLFWSRSCQRRSVPSLCSTNLSSVSRA